MTEKLSSVVIVGRPNVGKSTIFNRLTGTRRSIVTDEPGITRDRIYGTATWEGRKFEVVDTGGIVPDDKAAIPREIFRQAQVAIESASQLLLVVDARAGLMPLDAELAHVLRRTGKPLAIVANKVDSQMQESLAAPFYGLSNEVFPVSAEHGYGIDTMLDTLVERLGGVATDTDESIDAPAGAPDAAEEEAAPQQVNVAIIGRPNVGKSTMLNRLAGAERSIVSDIPGTTRDAVDTIVEHGGRTYRFVDTAGIRRKGKTKMMAEKLSVVMARRHLEAADVALLVIDATEGVTSSDATIGGYAHESGRSVVLVVNKWDLVTTGRTDGKPPADKEIFEGQLRNVLKYLSYAPVVFISAAEGKNIHSVLKLVKEVAAERRKRVSTGQMNRFLEKIDFQRATVPAANKMRIFYMTQAAVAPPTFILFTNRQVKLHFAFQRFLENQIRAAFGFRGSPIWFKVRAREK